MSPPPDDRSTVHHVRAARDGDASAWTRVVAKIDDELRPRLRPRDVPSPWDVDDVLQIVVCEVFRTIGKFGDDADDDFRAWIRTIMRMRLADLGRRRRTRDDRLPAAGAPDSEAAPPDWIDATALPPSAIVRGREAEQRVAAIAEQLSDRHRAALELREHDGLDFASIASRLDLASERAARNLFAYARQRRAELMASHYDSFVTSG